MAKQAAGSSSGRPIIHQTFTTKFLLTPASAHLSAQQYDFAPEFGAGVEAKLWSIYFITRQSSISSFLFGVGLSLHDQNGDAICESDNSYGFEGTD
jgi:hypothetical protein